MKVVFDLSDVSFYLINTLGETMTAFGDADPAPGGWIVESVL
jgi:hypothetical protein